MTRHFYDLEKLMNTPYADLAINDAALYHEIVEHRRKFYHVGYVDYDKDLPDSITILPKEALYPSMKLITRKCRIVLSMEPLLSLGN